MKIYVSWTGRVHIAEPSQRWHGARVTSRAPCGMRINPKTVRDGTAEEVTCAKCRKWYVERQVDVLPTRRQEPE